MTKNFRVYVDRGGNMPQLRHSVWKFDTHPFYIRYINDRPVAYHGPVDVLVQNLSRDGVWCYQRGEFVSINSLTAE